MSDNYNEVSNQTKKGGKGLKIALVILYLLITIGLAIYCGSVFMEHPDSGWNALLVIVILIYGGFAYCVPTLISLIGLIVSLVKLKSNAVTKGQIVFYVIFTLLPAATLAIMFLTIYLIVV
ncbi:MAG: hypothetical protein E7369_00170 [Clostridiales bacterium]|nr:hypothetical protein [Clostridiales bacterium]